MTTIRLVKKSTYKSHKRNYKKKHHKKSLFNQKGKSKLLILFVVSLFIVPIVVGGLSVLSKKTRVNNFIQQIAVGGPSIQPTLNPNCEYNDPELCKYLTNEKNYENVSIISAGTEGEYGNHPSEILTELSTSESGVLLTHMVIKQDGKETSNYISIGDTSYSYDYYKKIWWKETSTEEEKKSGEQFLQRLKKFALEYKDDPHYKMEYKFNTKEPCGDKMCFKYESNYLDQPEVKIFFWFDDQEYLKRRERFVDPGAGVIESVSSYGNVYIVAPSPVQESPY